jgi:hypothetical protein
LFWEKREVVVVVVVVVVVGVFVDSEVKRCC